MKNDVNSDLLQELKGFRLTTAQIYYHMPDHPHLLQEFIWQHHDLAPKFPRLYGFLDFWKHEIDGTLHSVYIAKKKIIGPNDSKIYDTEFTLQ